MTKAPSAHTISYEYIQFSVPAVGTSVHLEPSEKHPNVSGTVKIIEYERDYEGRGIGNPHRKPGVYQKSHHALVEDVDGNRGWASSSNLQQIPNVTMMEDFDHQKRIADLPETEFWEGDMVMTSNGQLTTILAIDYNSIDQASHKRIIDGKPYVCEQFKRTFHAADDLTLVERGNIWKKAHGKELAFHDLYDEIAFHVIEGDYTFADDLPTNAIDMNMTAETLISKIESGEADIVREIGIGLRAIKFTDREFGETARADYLEKQTQYLEGAIQRTIEHQNNRFRM